MLKAERDEQTAFLNVVKENENTNNKMEIEIIVNRRKESAEGENDDREQKEKVTGGKNAECEGQKKKCESEQHRE